MKDKNESRNLVLTLEDSIDNQTIEVIVKSIITINEEDRGIPAEERVPINLFINSYGGCCTSGFALGDLIEISKTPVNTICMGSCESMAMYVYLCGKKRYCFPNSTFLFNGVRGGSINLTATLLADLVKKYKTTERQIIDKFLEKTFISIDTLEGCIRNQKDYVVTADTAIKLKISDGYFNGDLF